MNTIASRRKRTTQFDYQRLEPRQVLSTWIPQGPFSASDGQVENVQPEDRIAGAVHTVIAHPTNPDVIYVGGTNSGVWRTTNATAANPNWTPLTDDLPSQSIGAMTFDKADPTYQTIYAGVGRYSSFGRIGNVRAGLYKTVDGGDNWTVHTDQLLGANISGVAANGNTVVVSVNVADSFNFSNVGIFRSTDGAQTFTQVSIGDGSGPTGLPQGVSYDLIQDPNDPNILYTSTTFSDSGGTNGVNSIYKSLDGGATWVQRSDPAIDALIVSGQTSNIEMAVGNQDNVYAAIINFGNLAGLFRSGDGGLTWVQMDTPSTNENGTDVGLNPRGGKGPQASDNPSPPELAGGQGAIHFSIVADPDNPNLVYVGGDRQPRSFGDAGSFPNSIGAFDFSGRLFRGDASQPAGSQFVHLTHSNSLGAPGGGTASSSAPHADSREMVFDANGDIIEVDDGGIYRRTSPKDNTGDWFAITGDIQVTEAHDVAYDNLSNVFMTGNQDTGTTYQPSEGSALWDSFSTADGGDVVVDNVSLAGSNQSVRYSSFQNLGGFRRTVWDATGNLVSVAFPALNGLNDVAFVTPVVVNAIDPQRIVIQGNGNTHESLDQGENVTNLNAAGNGGIFQNAIAYGGFQLDVANPDVLWVGSGANIFVRTAAGAALAATTNPGFGTIRDLSMDPSDWASVVAVDNNQVFWTTDVGISWADITGNLLSLGVSTLHSTEFVSTPRGDALLVGTNAGVFSTMTTSPGTWTRVGFGLPNVLNFDMGYDPIDDVLFVGTLGRGVWALPVASVVVVPGVDLDYGDAPTAAQSGLAKDYPVLFGNNGAGHLDQGPTLGTSRDIEIDGFPSLLADGDDLDASDDENGVTIAGPIAVSTTSELPFSFTLNLQNADPVSNRLDAWIDFNRDGDWLDEGERIFTNFDLGTTNGNQVLSFDVPQKIGQNVITGSTYARFRVSTKGVYASTGIVADGEVEDYRVDIVDAIAPTDGDDVIFITIDPTQTLVNINGLGFSIDRSLTPFYNLDGRGGYDRVTVLSSTTPDTANIRDFGFSLLGAFDINAINVEEIELFSRGGGDQVNILGTAGDELFESFGNRSLATGTGFSYGVRNYANTTFNGAGGTDTANLFGSNQSDRLMAGPFAANLDRPAFDVRVEDVDRTSVFGGGGLNDLAGITATTGNDTVFANETFVNVNGPGMWLNVARFSRVDVDGSTGVNIANLHGETGSPDLFFTAQRMGYMDGANYFNYLTEFDEIYGTSSDSRDRAIMNDSPGDDTLYATPGFATLTGSNYKTRASMFSRVTTIGTAGNNIATLADSAGDDVFVATPEFAYLLGPGYLNYTINFDRVAALASTGNDKGFLRASIGNAVFRGSYQFAFLAGLTGNDYVHSVSNFDQVTAEAHPVGNTFAELIDGPGNDTLVANGTLGPTATIFDGQSLIQVKGFKRVKATKANSGIDRLFANNNLNFVLEVMGPWFR